MASTQDTITIRLDPEALAILERLALAFEALVRQHQIAPPAPPTTGAFLGEE